MKWIKKGKIFDPTMVDLGNGCNEFAQSPQTLEFDNFIRIYLTKASQNRLLALQLKNGAITPWMIRGTPPI